MKKESPRALEMQRRTSILRKAGLGSGLLGLYVSSEKIGKRKHIKTPNDRLQPAQFNGLRMRDVRCQAMKEGLANVAQEEESSEASGKLFEPINDETRVERM